METFWFCVIALLWLGYLFLEGFDFGVGMLLPVLGRDETERRVLINTIGPVWDGNEVWLIVAVGATFAAFPGWYATLLSGAYLPVLVVLLALGSIATPFLGNSFGWIFTEMGRQPFVVVPNPSGVDGVWMFTARAVSSSTPGEVLTSLISLTLVYGVLAVVEGFLVRRYVRAGVAGVLPDRGPDGPGDGHGDGPGGGSGDKARTDDDVLSFAY